MRYSIQAILAAALVALSGPARAQDARCDRLDAQLRAIEQAGDQDPDRIARYRDAVERQGEELARTREYADSIGCDSALFGGPPQCRALDDNMRRMERNLALLKAQFARLSANLGAQRDAERRRTLALLANLDCNGTPSHADPDTDPSRAANPFEQLFGPDEMETQGSPGEEPRTQDEQAALPAEPLPPLGPLPRGANMRTICVRSCDGYFFPISFSTSSANFAHDAEVCRRQCPAATVDLYAYDTFSQTVEDAVSTTTGAPLSTMPNAFKFRTKLDQACTCHRAGESPAQSQAPAGDALKRLDEDALPGGPADAGGAIQDQGAAATLGRAGPPRKAAADSLPTTEGKEIETTTPDGKKKRVRVITPGLTPVQ